VTVSLLQKSFPMALAIHVWLRRGPKKNTGSNSSLLWLRGFIAEETWVIVRFFCLQHPGFSATMSQFILSFYAINYLFYAFLDCIPVTYVEKL
jgi:hypothetical protein